MNLNPFVESLRNDLAAAASAAGDDAREVAERLTNSLDAAVRLMLIDALSTATDEITSELAPTSVELRVRGREPQFVVTTPSFDDTPEPPTPPPPPPHADTGELARISLRLPEALKAQSEHAASNAGMSLNAWLVQAIADALGAPPGAGMGRRRRRGHSISGWAH